MANTDNDKVVKIPDGLEEGAILRFDITNERFVDSGVKAKYGSLLMDSGALNLGPHEISGTGENVVFKNEATGKIYYPPWKELDPTGKEERPMTSRTYTSELKEASIGQALNSVIVNPDFITPITSKSSVFQVEVIFLQAYTDVIVEVFYSPSNEQFWKSIIPHVEAGKRKVQLDIPIDVYPGDLRVKIYLAGEEPIELRGDAQGHPYLNFFYRTFEEVPLATETFVLNEISGGHQAAYLDKATYDPDNDGSVVLADKIKGADAAPNDHYYGKNGSGNVGFFPVPSGGPVDSDVMLKTVYDTNNDGVVDVAKAIADASSADADTYYGKDEQGNIGFLAFPDDPAKNLVSVIEFSDTLYKPDTSVFTEMDAYFIYKGPAGGAMKLPTTQVVSEHGISVTVSNKSNVDSPFTIRINSSDTFDNIAGSKHSMDLPTGASVKLVSDKDLRTWFIVDGVHHYSTEQSVLDDIKANTDAIAAHTTAIEGHGTQLATHASTIASQGRNITLTSQGVARNTSAIETSSKNAISGITLEKDDSSKTVTMKLTSENGIQDTAVIDLSSWFSGGTNPPSKDYKLYYGFASRTSLSESDLIRLSTSKTVPTIDGLDIVMHRTGHTQNYMYVWLPDGAGTIKGFTFGGFLSAWDSVAMTVAGVPGKYYTSPNQTSATDVSFEVTK